MRTSLRALIQQEKPLVTPLAHDALTARLIARAGFRAIAVGGSGLLAARYGLPIVAVLVETSGGTLDLRPAEPHGLEAVLLFPAD